MKSACSVAVAGDRYLLQQTVHWVRRKLPVVRVLKNTGGDVLSFCGRWVSPSSDHEVLNVRPELAPPSAKWYSPQGVHTMPRFVTECPKDRRAVVVRTGEHRDPARHSRMLPEKDQAVVGGEDWAEVQIVLITPFDQPAVEPCCCRVVCNALTVSPEFREIPRSRTIRPAN